MDAKTSQEIDRLAWRTLRDAGLTQPPIQIEHLLEHLNLHRHFYDLSDPGFLDRAKHKLRIHGHRLVDLVRKIRLTAALFVDEDRIAVDESLPEIKRDWPSFHETSHRIIPWHKPYYYGDTAQTLDPDWQELLEAEANHGAANLMFCGPLFGKEAKDVAPRMAQLRTFKTRYRKSMVATLRRYIQCRSDIAIALLVSTPKWMVTPVDQEHRWRYFIRSKRFDTIFPSVTAEHIRVEVDKHARIRAGGPVAEFETSCDDLNGECHEVFVESFFNSYYLITLIVDLGVLAAASVDICQSG